MRASRLVALLMILQARGKATASELAAELQVSERTIYRDVEALEEAGVPLYGEGGHDGGYRLVNGYRTRLTGLTECEAEALFLTLLPGPATELGFEGYAAAARRKVVAALPALLATRLASRFLLDAADWTGNAPGAACLPALAQAVKASQAIRIGGQELHPYGVVLEQGAWYLVAHDGADFGIHAVARLDPAAIDITGDFRRDESFDLHTYWSANREPLTGART